MNKQPSTITGAVQLLIIAVLALLVKMEAIPAEFQADILGIITAAIAVFAIIRSEKT